MVGPQDMKGFTLARVYRSAATDETPEAYLLLVNSEVRSNPDGSTYMRAFHAGDMQKNAIPLSMLDIDALTTALHRAKTQLLKDQAAYHERRRREEADRSAAQDIETAFGSMEEAIAALEAASPATVPATRSVAEVVAEAVSKTFKDFDW